VRRASLRSAAVTSAAVRRWAAGPLAAALLAGAIAVPAVAQDAVDETADDAAQDADDDTDDTADDTDGADEGTTDAPDVDTPDATADDTSVYTPPSEALLPAAPAGWPSPEGLDSSAYALVDAATGQVLAAADATEKRPVASTVKVLTVLSAAARVELDEQVTVGAEVEGVPGSGVGLEPGDTWTVAQLFDGLIARSGNEAAEAIATHVGGDVEGFLELMRTDVAAMGLEDIDLVSVSGLDDDNRMSALDLATIARVALAQDELRPFFGRTQVTLPTEGLVDTRNQLLTLYPDATGLKTGFTSLAGNSLIGSAERDGRELIAVVLDAGDDPARFDAAAALLDLGFDRFRAANLEASLRYTVAGGEVVFDVDQIPVVTPSDTQAQLALQIQARPPDGDIEVDVRVGEDVLAEVTAVRDDSARADEATRRDALGAAAADGAWAALRAASAGDRLR
jgi:serine-type D-Ala-D-Ala carboxypeptidase (penicillin-binding protein 5/6)